ATESRAADAARDERADRLGTGHGEREYAPTRHVAFERAGDRPNELVRIRYDSHDNLLALGVIRPRPQPAAPDPFPVRFVPDPQR
ncbi:MAG: hypothetical protein H7Y61_16630, partial [Rhizobiales bacterium]|nr:hypothetical protein [Rhizobacter sp.]